jgi:hypothetical protein
MVIDVYSRKVVGWAFGERMTADLVGEIGKDGFDQYYRKFEELLPGVGALEVKPGNAEDINASKEALEGFIRSCLREMPPRDGIYSKIQAASAENRSASSTFS